MRLTRKDGFLIAGGLYTLAFILFVNIIYSNQFPWIIFCVPALIMWPLCACRPRVMGHPVGAWAAWLLISGYYMALNAYFPGYPWSVIVTFALLWYPMSVTLAARSPRIYSIVGLLWAVLFFGFLNRISTPGEIWAVYPCFAFAWWPLSVCFFYKKDK